MDTKEVLKLETALKDAREKVKTELLGRAELVITELRTIGFHYELTETNGTPKMGRPRKEKSNGVVQQG
jgi:hypothetical protein